MGEDLKKAVPGPGSFSKEGPQDWPAWARAFSRSAKEILAALQESSQEENENVGGEDQTSNTVRLGFDTPTPSQISSAWSRLELLVQDRIELLHAFKTFLKTRGEGEWAALGESILSEALALDHALTVKLAGERDRYGAILADLATVKVNLAHLAQGYGT